MYRELRATCSTCELYRGCGGSGDIIVKNYMRGKYGETTVLIIIFGQCRSEWFIFPFRLFCIFQVNLNMRDFSNLRENETLRKKK